MEPVDEPLLQGDLVFAVAQAATQQSLLALRETCKSLAAQVDAKWAQTHLAPQTKLSEELVKR